MFIKHSSRGRFGFTLIEIMLVVAILSLLAAMAIPSYIRSRKRSQAVHILDDLKAVDHALEIYAAETRRTSSDPITEADLEYIKLYLKERTMLYNSLPNDLFGNEIVMVDFANPPRLSSETFAILADVTTPEFWSPYSPPE